MNIDINLIKQNFDLKKLNARQYGLIFSTILAAYFALKVFMLISGYGKAGSADPRVARNDLRCYQIYENLSNLHRAIGRKYPTNKLTSKDIFGMQDDIFLRDIWIIDQDYNDILETVNETRKIKNSDIDEIKKMIIYKKRYNPHEDVYLETMLKNHLNMTNIPKQKAAILGLFKNEWVPWIESLLLLMGMKDVTMIDYTKKEYENSYVKWISLSQYLSDKLSRSSLLKLITSYLQSDGSFDSEFDFIISHLAIENIGLGRYGEPLYPVSKVNYPTYSVIFHCSVYILYFFRTPISIRWNRLVAC